MASSESYTETTNLKLIKPDSSSHVYVADLNSNLDTIDTSIKTLQDNAYTLPTASADTLGGIKVGENLSITDGVLKADAQKIDTTTLYVTAGEKTGGTVGSKATAEGNSTDASGSFSHAEGESTTASGTASHASGMGTTAAGDAQAVFGKYNKSDTTSLLLVGNGTSDTPSNALTLDASGNLVVAGSVNGVDLSSISGKAATVEVGTTTTLDEGSSATVTNSGTSSAAVFNFGIPVGATGKSGTSTYVHIAYAGSSDGSTGFSTSYFDNALYIGFLTNTTESGSTTYSDYAWARLKGSDSTYLHFAYASSSDGATGFSMKYFDGALYIGVLSNNTETGSTTYSDYVWLRFKGDTGSTGTVAVGKITELSAGATPTVTNSGSDSAAVLDFGFPATNVSAKALTLTLSTSGWKDNAQTVSADGVSTKSTIIVTYAPASKSSWQAANISASGQADGTLTFVCDETPTGDITANVLVMSVVA